jgi:flagellar hook-associated protein 1 FlgK
MGLSIGLDTGVSALRAAQLGVDTAAHNISNANTEGYSRQEVMFRAVPPADSKYAAGGIATQQLGLGVESGRIRRIRDGLLDVQYRDVRSLRDEYQARAAALEQLEVTLNEPSDQGLQALMTKFFNSVRELASQPESVAARAAAVEQGATLASAFNRVSTLLTNQRADLDSSVDVKVTEINGKAKEVADLNAQIRKMTVAGGQPNDLLDKRDLLLDELAGLAGATFTTGADNTVNVLIGGRALVDNTTVNALATVDDPANANLNKVIFAGDTTGTPAPVTTGELRGIMDARDNRVTPMLTNMDAVAGTLITAVNAYHRAGFGLDNSTGLDWFTGTKAADMGVNQTLRDNPAKLATSGAPNEPGNTDTARAIAGVQTELLANGGTATIHDAYRSMMATLGVDSQQAQLLVSNQSLVTDHLENARQSVAGVSIDEEMTNLIKGQRAYQAAARVIATVDEMLDTLVNRT